LDLDLRRCASRGQQKRNAEGEGPRPWAKGDYCQHVFHCVFRFSCSCNSRHRILPVAVLGSASTNSTTRGTLNAAMRLRAQSMISPGLSRPFADALGTTTALTVSPR